jgi:hypothetical protein
MHLVISLHPKISPKGCETEAIIGPACWDWRHR